MNIGAPMSVSTLPPKMNECLPLAKASSHLATLLSRLVSADFDHLLMCFAALNFAAKGVRSLSYIRACLASQHTPHVAI